MGRGKALHSHGGGSLRGAYRAVEAEEAAVRALKNRASPKHMAMITGNVKHVGVPIPGPADPLFDSLAGVGTMEEWAALLGWDDGAR